MYNARLAGSQFDFGPGLGVFLELRLSLLNPGGATLYTDHLSSSSVRDRQTRNKTSQLIINPNGATACGDLVRPKLLLCLRFPATVPDRKLFSATSATVLDVLEGAAHVRYTSKDEGGEEQASSPSTTDNLANTLFDVMQSAHWFMLPLVSFVLVVPRQPQYGQSTRASTWPRSRRGIGTG